MLLSVWSVSEQFLNGTSAQNRPFQCHSLSGAKCRLFACGPADAIAIAKLHHFLPDINPDWVYLSGTSYPCCPEKEAVKWV